MAIFQGSRYQNTVVYSYIDASGNITPTFTNRVPPASFTNPVGGYQTYYWTVKDRIDILAHDTYGDSAYWWAIMDANPQYMTPFDIPVGATIILPPYEAIREALGNG